MKNRKLNLGKARRTINQGKDLSLKEIGWNVPIDLRTKTKRENPFELWISLGKYKDSKTKFILIMQEGTFIYLEKEIVKKMWESLK